MEKLMPSEVNTEATLKEFGYETTTKSSDKPVIINCCVCGALFRSYRSYIAAGEGFVTCGKGCKTKRISITMMERHGAPWAMQSKSVQAKVRETMTKNWGGHSSSHKNYKEKCRETVRKNWGVDHVFQSGEFKKASSATLNAKYGVDNAMRDEALRSRQVQSTLENLGVPYAMQSQQSKDKSKQTSLIKYGVSHPSKHPTVREKGMRTMISEHGTVNPYAVARKAGNTAEQHLCNWLNSLGFNFKESVIPGPVSLDGLDEEKKVAFEFNGLYWHSENSDGIRGEFYHISKTLACRAQGIRLFQIWEDEWENRQDQVKGFLKASLGVFDRKFHARKCAVRIVEDKVAQDFYDRFHIQGRTTKGIASAGLFVSDELVGCMTFGRHHRQGQKDTVLTRLCFADGVWVVGGASKMLKLLRGEVKPTGLISWSDNRWSEGGVYKAMGFVFEEDLGPDYEYVKLSNPRNRVSKQSQRKSAVDCPEGMTELQWANQRGLSRIWDCGKVRWRLNLKSTVV